MLKMNREQFDTWWKSKGHTPSDTDFAAYQLGQKTSQQTLQGAVEAQQNKIAEQIRKAGELKDSDKGKDTTPTADHHPQHHYQSWGEYSGTLRSMGYGVTRAQYDAYMRGQGITTQSDHEISKQTIHSGDQGTGSIAKKEPEHVHDQKQGKTTIPDRTQGKTKPTTPSVTPAIPSAGTRSGTASKGTASKGTPSAGVPSGTASKGTASKGTPPTPAPAPRKTYPYPYTNLPFDPRRTPEEIEDPSISQKYKTQLEQWSFENFNRYQKKQPLLAKPKPGDVFVDKASSALGSSNSNTELQRLLNASKLVLAEDKITPYQLAAGKQLPYWLYVEGKKQPKLYNASGGLYDETGPRMQNLGRMKEGSTGVADTPDKILNQGISRAFDLVGAIGGAASVAAKVGKVAAVGIRAGRATSAAANRVRAIAAARASRLAQFGGRNPGSAFGLINRGSACLGRGASRIGELPSSGGASRVGELPSSGATDALQDLGL